MIDRIVVSDDGEGWPYIRSATFCAICRGDKPVGKIVCDTCRTTRTFLSMTQQLTATEQSLEWNATRRPDQAAPKRATDPPLAPCRNCEGTDLVFVRFETPGMPITRGGSLRHNVDHYVRCNTCRMQTTPCTSKKLAAKMWADGGWGNFIPKDNQ